MISFLHFTAFKIFFRSILFRSSACKVRSRIPASRGVRPKAGERNSLILSCDHANKYVLAVDKLAGTDRWRQTEGLDGRGYATPYIIDTGERKEMLINTRNRIAAFDPATGQYLWTAGGLQRVMQSMPVYKDGVIYTSGGWRNSPLMALRPGGKGDVTDSHVPWQTNTSAPHNPSPLVVGDNLYFVSDSGVASCVDARTGEEHWQERIEGEYWASPIFADGKIYFQDKYGMGVVVAEGTEFQELGRNVLGEDIRSFASYAVWDGALFIRTETHLYRVEDGS